MNHWESTGLLNGLSDEDKIELSEILDDALKYIKIDKTGVYLPLVRRLWNLGKRNFNHKKLYKDFSTEWESNDPNTYYTYNDIDIEKNIFDNIIKLKKDTWLHE